MVLGLLMGCNNGGEDPQKVFLKSVVSLGSNFLDVFTSFGEMAGGVLGFNETTTKSKVGEYFKQVKETVEGAKSKLNTMVENMKAENNPNASKTADTVKNLNGKLDKIIGGASEALKGVSGPELLGNIGGTGTGGAIGDEVANLINGIKTILEAVELKEGKSEAGDTNKASSGTGPRTATDAGILFASNNAGSTGRTAATDAAKAVGAVTGADILQAIKSGGDAVTLAKNTKTDGSDGASKNDAVIAGAIALRAMAKGGKFANDNSNDVATSVKRLAVSAVTKALDTLTIAIKKTIDEGLKEVKEAMKISANDIPVTTTEAKN